MHLLYFSPVSWHSYPQRPHYLVRYLLQNRTVDSVLWVDSYPTRLPSWKDFHRPGTPDRLPPPFLLSGLHILKPAALPVEPVPGGSWLNHALCWKGVRRRIKEYGSRSRGELIVGTGRPHALAVWALRRIPHRASFYDAMDDFPAFYSGFSKTRMAATERKIAGMVDRVWYSSPLIGEKLHGLNPDMVHLPNGYDKHSFPVVRQRASGRQGTLVFGYVGTVGAWFDWDQVLRLAAVDPCYDIRIAGPCFVKVPDLPANITLYPACPHAKAVEHIAGFDICLIPFRRNELTMSVDPIKYYEYRAMGKPVLSTRFGTMPEHASEGGVAFFEEDNLQQCIEIMLQKFSSDSPMESFRKTCDWSTRFLKVKDWVASI